MDLRRPISLPRKLSTLYRNTSNWCCLVTLSIAGSSKPHSLQPKEVGLKVATATAKMPLAKILAVDSTDSKIETPEFLGPAAAKTPDSWQGLIHPIYGHNSQEGRS